MQFLTIDKKDTLVDISRIVGQNNISALLAENSLNRVPNIGQAWYDKCEELIASTLTDVTASRKATLLNSLTSSQELFEKACLMDEDEWKVFSAFQSFTDAIRIPEATVLPYSNRIIGFTSADSYSLSNVRSTRTGSSTNRSAGTAVDLTLETVSPVTYKAVMNNLKEFGTIDPSVFEKVNSAPGVKLDKQGGTEVKTSQFAFNIPWGKVQMYSSLLQEVVDFPAYPEQIETGRTANYTSMPDIIYQYEPWIVYQSSGPRQQTLSFHLHRDMWTGNHLDGNANRLIRFCESNTFPDYQGSAVLAPFIRFYIDGSLFISGVLTGTNVSWTGPLGQDNWYLEFTLTLNIQEVSETALNIKSVRNFGLKGN